MGQLSRCAELDLILISAVKEEEGEAPRGALLHLSLQSEVILLI